MRALLAVSGVMLSVLGGLEPMVSLRAATAATTTDAVRTQQYMSNPVGALAVGRLIVASRRVGDPTFAQSIILLVAYSHQGAAGLILNSQTSVPAQRVLPDLPASGRSAPRVFFGGPVAAGVPLGLFRSPVSPAGAFQVLPGVQLLGMAGLNKAIADGVTAELRVYVGQAGWGPGQLEGEVRRGDWYIFDGASALIFDRDPDTLWRRQIHLTELKRV